MKKLVALVLFSSSCVYASFSQPPKGGGGIFVVGGPAGSGNIEELTIPAQLAPIAAGDVNRMFGDPATPGFARDLSASSSFYAMVKDSSNRLVVCGYGNNSSAKAWLVARYTSAGVLDTTFGSGLGYVQENGIGVSEARGLAIDGSGNIITVGYSTVASVRTWTVIAYTSTGARTTLGPNANGLIQEDDLGVGDAYSISLNSTGNWYVGGYTTPSSVTVITIVSYTSAGLRNSAFNP